MVFCLFRLVYRRREDEKLWLKFIKFFIDGKRSPISKTTPFFFQQIFLNNFLFPFSFLPLCSSTAESEEKEKKQSGWMGVR